jgi:Family of unknown function (DUF6527)
MRPEPLRNPEKGCRRHEHYCSLADNGSFGSVAPPRDRIESWLISLPDGGEWITSQRASGGGYWTVTGTVPDITASPSIWHNAPHGWHGWIRDGFLENA